MVSLSFNTVVCSLIILGGGEEGEGVRKGRKRRTKRKRGQRFSEEFGFVKGNGDGDCRWSPSNPT